MPNSPDRPAAAVVIPAWNAWEHTRSCLISLRPTLSPRDKVVVVDNGSVDETPRGLAHFPWAKVVRNDENLGFATACNEGAATSTSEILVFLNSDTVPLGRWLDELIAPFADAAVTATGARSNFVSGPQLVPEARYSNKAELRDFERSWRQSHAGLTSEVGRLVGFCLAVRRSAFEAVGGFDEGYKPGGYEDDDLCRRLVEAGGKLVIAHGSFVHHVGHASFDANDVDWRQAELQGRQRFVAENGQAGAVDRPAGEHPKISACLIARDEEANIGRCLRSLQGVADEVVVADTGSTDATAAIARSCGATVVDVAWDDDFAKARNASLAHCSGDWVLWLDADEEWVGGGAELHAALAGSPAELDGWLVTITNEMGHGTEWRSSHPAVRVFRRRLVWKGRIHEQVVDPNRGSDTLVARLLAAGSIVHHGYTDEALSGRQKLERNLRLAELALDDVAGTGAAAGNGVDRQRAELNLGRCLLALGRADEALPHLDKAGKGPERPTSRLALHTATRATFSLADLEGAADRIATLRSISPAPLLADILTGELAWHAKLYDQAIAVLQKLALPELDEDNFLHQPSEVAHILAACHRASGRPGAAFEALLGPLAVEGVCAEPLSALVHDGRVAGADLARIGAAFPADKLEMFLAQVLQLDEPDEALAIIEGAWDAHPERHVAVLAAAELVASKGSPQAALPWAGRLRAAGLGKCPLLAIARDEERPVTDRVLAAASAYKAFSDGEAEELVKELAPRATGQAVPVVTAVLRALAPAYLGLVRQGPTVDLRPRSPEVSIVVPCWNRAEWTLALLKSLQATMPDGSYELVIVDNGSTDATSQVQANPEAGVVVVRNEANRGFAVACNQGAMAASADTVVFCNNDVVAKPGWSSPLLAALGRPGTAVVGPKLVFPDGSLQHAGVAILYNPDGQGFLDGMHYLYRQHADHPAANRPGEMRAVTGAVMAVRKRVFLDLGGFDEGYWNGNEDIDFCLRAGEAGWRVWYEPASVLVHQESASGTERYRETTANRARLTGRWAATVLDERMTDGVVVVGPFGYSGELDDLARSLVALADEADVPVVTRVWPGRVDGWAHRLGPGQRLVLSAFQAEETTAYIASEGSYIPGEAKVLAGREALADAGLLGPGAAGALRDLAGSKKKSARLKLQEASADCQGGSRKGPQGNTVKEERQA